MSHTPARHLLPKISNPLCPVLGGGAVLYSSTTQNTTRFACTRRSKIFHALSRCRSRFQDSAPTQSCNQKIDLCAKATQARFAAFSLVPTIDDGYILDLLNLGCICSRGTAGVNVAVFDKGINILPDWTQKTFFLCLPRTSAFPESRHRFTLVQRNRK